MKDRYRNFIEDHSYDDDQDNEEYEDEEYEDEELEDSDDEEEYDDESDGDGEKWEEDDEDSDVTEEEESEPEEKPIPIETKRPTPAYSFGGGNRLKPTSVATSNPQINSSKADVSGKPFGNGLNLPIGRRADAEPAKVTPAAPTTGQSDNDVKTKTPSIPVTSAPTTSTPATPNLSSKQEAIDFSPVEENEEEGDQWEKSSFMERLTRLIPIPASLRKRRNLSEDNEDEEKDEKETEKTVEVKSKIRDKLLKPFLSFSAKVRGRLNKKETVEEFKKGLEETGEELPVARLRDWPGILKKTGIITGIVSVLFACAYSGTLFFFDEKDDKTEQTASAGNDGGINPLEGDNQTENRSLAFKSRTEETPADEGVTSLKEETFPIDSDPLSNLSDPPSASNDITDGLSDPLASDVENVSPEITAPETEDDSFNFDSLEKTPSPTVEAEMPAELSAELPAELPTTEPEESSTSVASSFSPREGTDPNHPDGEPVDQSFNRLNEDLAEAGATIKENAQEGLNRLGQTAQQGIDQISDQFQAGTESLDRSLQNAGNQANDYFHQAGEKIDETIQNVENKADNLAQQTGESLDSALQNADSSLHHLAESAQDSASRFGTAARQAPLQVSIAAPNSNPSSLSLEPSASGRTGDSSLGNRSSLSLDDSLPRNNATLGSSSLGNSSLNGSSSAGMTSTPSANQSSNPTPPVQITPSATNPVSTQPESAPTENAQAATPLPVSTPTVSNLGGLSVPEPSDPFSNSLSPMGDYAAPGEIVSSTASTTNAPLPAPPTSNAATLPNSVDPNAGSLSSLNYNPTQNYNSTQGGGNPSTTSLGTSTQSGLMTTNPAITGTLNYREYQTKSGDNLLKIAANELGDSSRWAEISKLNPDKNLRGRLQEGIVIKIPTTSSEN